MKSDPDEIGIETSSLLDNQWRMIGTTISHYRILQELGRGGMGVVYKAQDLTLDRFVALKFLPPHLAASDQDKARFIQEAKAAAALSHPNVCSIYDIQEHDTPAFVGAPAGPDVIGAGRQMFIVMEYVEGGSIRSRLRNETLRIDEIVGFGLQIAEGLKAAHKKDIIHRDIKSDNIMVANDGRVKIMDFGLAKLKSSIGVTKTGSTVGTISYMSPEQIQSAEVDQGADIWSFGVVLYEMVTGQLPFPGEHEAAVMYEILNEQPKAVEFFRSDVPENLQVLLSLLLQKDRAKRIPSAEEIIKRLKRSPTETSASAVEKSMAVLYFENMSPEKESEYFCAGITEDIITDLSKIKELKVISRTDVLPFRNKEVNIRQVGEALRVNYILEGSVRKTGNKIRITAQLIDVRSGFHIWADRFDRLVEDILDLQIEVSQKIAEALKVSLTESEKQSLAQKPTDDLRAYDFYMRGRECLYRRGKKNNELAIQMFENALLIDANFASAYAALAEAYSYMYSWYDGDSKWLAKIIETSQKALALVPTSAEAQFGIGMVYFHQKRFTEAKRTLEKVIQQKPDFYDAYRWLGIISDITGDYDAAIRYYERTAAIKPYSEEPWMHFYMTYLRKGDKVASDKAQEKLLKLGIRKLEVNPDDAITLSRMAGPFAHFGEKEKAYSAIKRVLDIDPTDGLARYNCACTYAVLGDKEEALRCLKGALESGYKNVREWVKSDPDFASVREDPEFKTLLAEFG